MLTPVFGNGYIDKYTLHNNTLLYTVALVFKHSGAYWNKGMVFTV